MAKARHGWHTPDSLAGDEICRPLFLPANDEVLSLVGGALAELTKTYNYEMIGSITPREIADYMTTIITRWYADQCGGGACETVPFWQTDDGEDAGNEEPVETWYEEVSWWIIEAFLATTITPAAAVTFVTTTRTLHLAFKRGGFGALIEAFIDDVLIDVIDTYSAGTPLLEWIYDTGDDEEHTLKLVHSGQANASAEEDPVLGGYRMDVIRKNIRFRLPNFSFQTRYDEASDIVQTSVDGGTTWQDAPQSDPRHQTILPPPNTADPRCDAAARMTAYLEQTVNDCIAALQASASAAELVIIIQGGILIFFNFFSILWALIVAIAGTIFNAGYEDMNNSFTSDVWDDVLCYLYAAISPEGVLTASGLNVVRDFIYNGQDTTVFNVLSAIFNLTGEAALNGMASLRTETGDCNACSGLQEYYEHFNTDLLYGTVIGGDGVHVSENCLVVLANTRTADPCGDEGDALVWVLSNGQRKVNVTLDLGVEMYIGNITVAYDASGSVHSGYLRAYKQDGTIAINYGVAMPGGSGCLTWSPAMALRARWITITIVTNTSQIILMDYVRLYNLSA